MIILTVEDDAAIREAITEVLTYSGHKVMGARNGLEGLNFLQAGLRPQIILLDLMMPVMDGWTFLEEILKTQDLIKIPVIIVSAVVTDGTMNTYPNVKAIIKKPVMIENLLKVIKEIHANDFTISPSASP